MAWIETTRGDYINTAHISMIDTYLDYKDGSDVYEVRAYFNGNDSDESEVIGEFQYRGPLDAKRIVFDGRFHTDKELSELPLFGDDYVKFESLLGQMRGNGKIAIWEVEDMIIDMIAEADATARIRQDKIAAIIAEAKEGIDE